MARETREQAKSDGDKLGTSLDDAWIHTKISGKLNANANTPARKINIDCERHCDIARDRRHARGEGGSLARRYGHRWSQESQQSSESSRRVRSKL
jgi:hypothetical protein